MIFVIGDVTEMLEILRCKILFFIHFGYNIKLVHLCVILTSIAL